MVVRYEELPSHEWDGKNPLYSIPSERYFLTWEEVDEYCKEKGCTREDLMLLLTVPEKFHRIDPFEYSRRESWWDESSFIVPSEILKAFDALNESIMGCERPCGYKYILERPAWKN